jgi:hypothetical protein
MQYPRNFLEGQMQGLKDYTSATQLRPDNAALMTTVDELHAPRMHQGPPTNLEHGGQQKIPAFFLQLTDKDLP